MKKMILMFVLTMFLFGACDAIKTMTFDFEKDSSIHEPTIAVYDEEGFLQSRTVMYDDEDSIEILCWIGEKYCWGAWTSHDEWGCGRNCDNSVPSACKLCKEGSITVRLEEKEATTAQMTWKFTKDLETANPTIGLYDHTDFDTELATISLDQKVVTKIITCTIGNNICYGGDFTLLDNEYELGCGDNCASYDDLTSSEKSDACETCGDKTVERTFDNFI
ncbi:hypothetical protein KAH37_09015 [bacterium]|nr:hypothetical protein [bacterium]